MKRHVEIFRRHLWLRRVCYGLLLFAVAAFFALMSFEHDRVAPSNPSALSLPTSIISYSWQRETTKDETDATSIGEMQIEDVISFGSEVLFLVRVSATSVGLLKKERLECRYRSRPRFSDHIALAVHVLRDCLAAVVCGAPPEANLPWDLTSALLTVDKDREIRSSGQGLESTQPWPWNATKLVYEVFPTQHDVAVFVHGFNQTLGYELTQFQCVYGGGQFATAVTAQANEVFRCGHPPTQFAGKKISLRFDGKLLPSLVYYNPAPIMQHKPEVHHVCACTMIYNGAKFLREWIYYHSHLGVEKFFIYDNNSDDNLDEVIAELARFNVTKHAWPWVKTQEAAFSHCALLAQPECTWMLFTDVDEYFFPSDRFLNAPQTLTTDGDVPTRPNAASHATAAGHGRSTPSILARFIQDAVAARARETVQVGQIATYCRNFGPSGLEVSPPQGVTQGYTCRLQRQRRVKSIVLLAAIDDSLGNQVHHFSLKAPFVKEQIRPWVAIINHYKFQVWDEFKTKFHRRAATYVADWTEDRNHASNDRVPGLGMKPVKPADWEYRYCEVRDYGLRNYTRRIFGSHCKGKLRLAWEPT